MGIPRSEGGSGETGSLHTPKGGNAVFVSLTTNTVYKQPRSRRYSFSKEFCSPTVISKPIQFDALAVLSLIRV